MSLLGLWVLGAVYAVVVAYFVLLNLIYLLTGLVAFRALRRYANRLQVLDTEELIAGGGVPPITLIAPAFNEEATCVEATRALLTLRYPDYEILVVNDGSRDGTLARLTEAFALAPAVRAPMAPIPTRPVRAVLRSAVHANLWVIDKENGGKADALNAGLDYARTPLFCALDADSLLEPDALARVVRPFLEDKDTVAVGGIIRIANGCTVEHGSVTRVRLPRALLARFQVLEYLRAFLSGRMAWAALDATLIISGAFGLFRRSIVVEAGGFATDTVGEDMELVVRLHRLCRERGLPYRITFVPDPAAWTECPETLRVLGRQRDRWQRGLSETLTRHRRMLFRHRYGRIGLLAYPFFFLFEMLGPAVEAAGYVAFVVMLLLGRGAGPYAWIFLLVSLGLGVAQSVAAVALEEMSFRRYPRLRDVLALFGLALAENFGYRQLSTWWRMKGMYSALRGTKGWGTMTRKGFAARTSP